MKNLLPIVCGRGGGIGIQEVGPSQSNGTDTTATSRIGAPIVATAGKITGLQVELAHITAEGVPTNPITRQLSLVVLGALYPLTFTRNPTVTLQPGDTGVLSDILPVPDLGPNDMVYCVDNVSAASGGVWATGNPLPNSTGDGLIVGTNAARSNVGMNTVEQYAHARVCIRGVSDISMPGGVLLIGDSITAGNGDDGHEFGYAVYACNTAGVGFINIALPGEALTTFLTNHNQRGQLLGNAPYHLLAYGTNDINIGRTFAQLKADTLALIELSRRSGSQYRGVCTIPPGEFTGQQETDRTTYNNYLRSGQIKADVGTYPLDVFDRAGVVEATSTGGPVTVGGAFWALDYKSNKLHPSHTGHVAMATRIPAEALRKAMVSSTGVLGNGDDFYGYNVRRANGTLQL